MIQLEVWGPYALFTRGEMKVERVSYDVPTPSAARGIVESIYLHPGMRWVIRRIYGLNPIEFTTIRRNEVKSKILGGTAMRIAQGLPKRPCSRPARPPRSPPSEYCQSKTTYRTQNVRILPNRRPVSSFLNQMSRRRCASRLKPRRSSKCQEFTLSGWQYASTRCSFFCAKASRFFQYSTALFSMQCFF